LLSTVLALFGASQSSAVIILGGGNPTTDCLSVFDVNANVLPTKPTRIDCIDGDPACDTDGACGNGCNFSVRLCVNVTTPSCSPSALKKKPTVKKGAGLTAPDSTGTASSCGDYENVTVPLQRSGKKYGQKRIEVLAVGSDNRKDRDELILRCVPRVGTCPTTTTTVSTTSRAPTVAPQHDDRVDVDHRLLPPARGRRPARTPRQPQRHDVDHHRVVQHQS
jgi:hypothetical protein